MLRWLLFPVILAFLLCTVLAWRIPSPPAPSAGDCLNLPEQYFNYAHIELPAHLQTPSLQTLDNTPDGNPTTDAGATLGRVLFYDSKLSANQTVACASCHKQALAFTDDATLSTGFEGGFTGRNSMSLAMARFYANGHFFWDERAATLEEQTLMPIQDPVEMGMALDELEARLANTDYYPALFEAAFGTPEITSDRMAMAMAQFVRSIVSYRSKYDLARQEAPEAAPDAPLPGLTPEENLGKAVFFSPSRGNCSACHGTEGFVAFGAFNNGLDLVYADPGKAGITFSQQDIGLFKVPSLRNVTLTAPYMHDGRFTTLEEVVDHYDTGLAAHPNLSQFLREGSATGPPRQLNLTTAEKT
ncbi:MAG: cytochrome-c peroxidase, partial [Phaeodactylibacter sp.]|nr:cytochrome-c peroxidase [Phaeodactylibacter sp.]